MALGRARAKAAFRIPPTGILGKRQLHESRGKVTLCQPGL